ncbi:MAG: hypothetical protein HYX69_18605 [Planctomycetia bacterium]|nr:hypothetical protein [Planctomycetia bacterium]
MTPNDTSPTAADTRLDEINTQWSLLRLAQATSFADSGPARQALALRYSGAIRRYVGALVRNQQDADEVAQDVLVRILRGDFGGADPQRGRFRDLLKVAIRNMVRTFWDRQQRRTGVNLDVATVADEGSDAEADAAWQATWQKSVLDMVWRALASYEQGHVGCVAHTVLRLRADYPDDDSDQLAARLSTATGKKFAPPATRQQLRRARLRFAQLLVEEISHGLKDASPAAVEEELTDLGLLEYVRDFLPSDWRECGELREAAV